MSRWQSGIALMVAVMLLAGGVTVSRAQDDPAEQVRGIVQQWLLQEIGKPGMILVEYSYYGTSWPDSSLGCPVQGQVYTPGEVQGFVWTFLYDNFVRYEVHSSLDAKIIVLCSATNAAPDVRMTPYRSAAFIVLMPEAWIATPNADQSEVLFGPQPQPVCDQPGMRVTVIGRVAAGVTPDQLIEDFLAQNDAHDTPSRRAPVGTFGRTTTYEAACDVVIQHRRLSTFVQYGSAYQVEQWVPQDQADQWDQRFLDMISQFGPPDSPFVAATPTPAPAAGGTAVADLGDLPALPLAHLFLGDLFLGALNDIPGRSITVIPTNERRYVTFSPDGLHVAFIDATAGELRVVDVVGGRSARKLAEGVDTAFPLAWSPTGQEIAYVTTAESGGDGETRYDLRAVPLAGGEIRTLATLSLPGDCAVSITDPADFAYFRETAAGGHIRVLVWMPDGQFLISTRCDGGIGLLNPADGRITPLGDDLVDGAASPDRARFAARTPDGLAVLDFTTWERTNLEVGEGVGQIAWSADGQTIYFSIETLAERVPLGDEVDQEQANEVFGVWPVEIQVYDLVLAKVTLATKQQTVLWQGQGRAIGRIAPAPDDSGLLFSLVGSSLPLLEVFHAGADPVAVREAYPTVALYWLPTGSTIARLLAYSGEPAFAPVTVN